MKPWIERLPHDIVDVLRVPQQAGDSIRNESVVLVGPPSVRSHLNFVCSDTNHFKRNSLHPNRFSNRRTVAEQPAGNIETEENNLAPFLHIF